MTLQDSKHPLVSVVIPSMNRAEMLVHTIESILQQDYPRTECIVVDGGSTDGTLDILRRYDGKIKWISEPDKGHADAINKGWKMGKGEILAWLNADDLYVVPDAVRKAVVFLKKNPHVDVAYGDCAFIDVKGHVSSEVLKPREWDLEYAVANCDHIIMQPASFIRRTILEKVDWLSLEFISLDHDLWYRIGQIGTIQYFPSHLAYVRDWLGTSHRPEVAEDKVRVVRKFLGRNNLPSHFYSDRFRRRAISNAYLVGGAFAWLGHHFARIPWYLLRSVISDPFNLPHIFTFIVSKVLRRIRQRLFPPFLKNGTSESAKKHEGSS